MASISFPLCSLGHPLCIAFLKMAFVVSKTKGKCMYVYSPDSFQKAFVFAPPCLLISLFSVCLCGQLSPVIPPHHLATHRQWCNLIVEVDGCTWLQWSTLPVTLLKTAWGYNIFTKAITHTQADGENMNKNLNVCVYN